MIVSKHESTEIPIVILVFKKYQRDMDLEEIRNFDCVSNEYLKIVGTILITY